jgi:uncharacterized repeat protein (TIGR01451 family)
MYAAWTLAMSRSHSGDDEDDIDDEDRPRRKRRSDDDDDSPEDDENDEEVEAPLGGWRPVGEAVFWGVVFLGLTLVAFSLGEGIGVKRPLAHKEPDLEKTETPVPEPPPKKPDESAFVNRIDPLPPDEPEGETKINLNAPPEKSPPPKAAVVSNERPKPIDEPPSKRLDWEAMIAKSQLKLQPRPKPQPTVDEGPSRRLDVEKLTKAVTLVPSSRRTDLNAMIRKVELESATRSLDAAKMIKAVELQPATRRLDVDRMIRLVTFTPRPKVEPPATPVPVKEATTAVALQMREVPSRLQVGKVVALVAKVVGSDGRPIPDQLVEWTLDRQGVGEIVAMPTDPRIAKPSERPWPTFARTYTAKAPHRLDATFGGTEIGVGETWIAVESSSAGGMHAAVQAPGIALPNARRVGAFFHWDRAKAAMPSAVNAMAGTEAVVVATITASDGSGSPLPDYRVRYTLTDANGAEAANGDGNGVVEVESRGDGRAPATFKQGTIKPGATRGKIELLGRKPLSGRSAEVIAAGEFKINWTGPEASIKADGPPTATAGEWVKVAVTGSAGQINAANKLRLYAIPDGELQLQSGSWSGPIDLGPWPGADARDFTVNVRRDAPGMGSLRFEVRQGNHVWTTAEHAIQFSAPVSKGVASLVLKIKDSTDPAPLGGEIDYEVLIENQGSAAARDVRVEFAPPVGLEIISASGSLGGTVKDGKYAPPPIDELAPGGRSSAKLRVKSAVNGDARLVVRLHHPSLAKGVVEEFEGTVVYRP